MVIISINISISSMMTMMMVMMMMIDHRRVTESGSRRAGTPRLPDGTTAYANGIDRKGG